MGSLTGRKLMVIGASSGMGRATALAGVRHGADVVFAARRRELLDEAVAEAGGGRVVTIDVLDADDVERAVNEAAAELGGLDGILYSAGMSPMRPMRDCKVADWQTIFGVNTFGPSLVIRAALPHLAADAVVMAVSSDSSHQPRHSLVPYAASKAALEATMEGWRTEEIGGRRFLTVVLGPTQPTGFADEFDPEVFGAAIPHWQRQGFRTGLMAADDVGEHLAATMALMFGAPTFGVDSILLRAPEPETPNEFEADPGA